MKTIGREIFCYQKVTSTQDKAKKLAERGAPEGTVITAEIQTQGKGRLGRRWISPRGGIWVSILLRPEMAGTEAPRITIIGSLAVAEAIAEFTGKEVRLKWPNDVMISPGRGDEFRKVCGVLTETVSRFSRVDYVIVGLGINVNNRIPVSLRDKAISLKDALGYGLRKKKLLIEVLKKFDSYYSDLRRKWVIGILRKYRDMSSVLGKEVRIECPEGTVVGKALEIDPYGALILGTKSGKKRVVAGDVMIL